MIHLLWLQFPGISQNSWLLHTVRSWVPGRGMIYFFTQSQPNWQEPTGRNVRHWRLLKTLSSSSPRFSVLFRWPQEFIPILCRMSASSVTARVWAGTACIQLERDPAYIHSNGALLRAEGCFCPLGDNWVWRLGRVQHLRGGTPGEQRVRMPLNLLDA